MNADGELAAAGTARYEVAVALAPADRLAGPVGGSDRYLAEQTVAGFEDLTGTSRRLSLLEKGEEALCDASDALARRAAIVAARMADAVSTEIQSTNISADTALEAIEVSFGITLSAGLQTVFTTQAESSVQVTVTLRCDPQRRSAPIRDNRPT